MTREEIKQLMRLLPKDNPWASQGLNAQATSRIDPCELALRDPGFGWRFAKFHVESGLSLDDSVVPPAILRAYHHLLQSRPVDLNVALAQALNLPESKPQRDLLRALLLCKDTTPETIAQICELDIEVVRLFESLFWNCLDRKQERVYVGRICQQIGQVGTTKRSDWPEDRGLELLRIVWQNGALDEVLTAAEVATPKEPPSIPQLLEQFRKAIMTSAAAGLGTKKASNEIPSLKLALKMAVASFKEKPTQAIEEGLSIEQSVRLVLDQITKRGEVVVSYEI